MKIWTGVGDGGGGWVVVELTPSKWIRGRAHPKYPPCLFKNVFDSELLGGWARTLPAPLFRRASSKVDRTPD